MNEKKEQARHYRALSLKGLETLVDLKKRIERLFPNLEVIVQDEWEDYGERRLWQTFVIRKKGSIHVADCFQPLNTLDWDALNEGKFGRREEKQFFVEHWWHLERMNGS